VAIRELLWMSQRALQILAIGFGKMRDSLEGLSLPRLDPDDETRPLHHPLTIKYRSGCNLQWY